jgi:hypothetical protein
LVFVSFFVFLIFLRWSLVVFLFISFVWS